jgi:uncharacterized membrane protein YeaQ/YmgE (transglycosylase-associated protein family)
MDFVAFIVVGLLAGWIAGLVMKGGGYGIIGDIILGVLGASIGGWLFKEFGVSLGGGLPASLVVATVGAIALILVLRLLKRA